MEMYLVTRRTLHASFMGFRLLNHQWIHWGKSWRYFFNAHRGTFFSFVCKDGNRQYPSVNGRQKWSTPQRHHPPVLNRRVRFLLFYVLLLYVTVQMIDRQQEFNDEFPPFQLSEDCLYLNVFTPLLPSAAPATPLPVMIFITGGNFQFLDASAPIYESERFVNTTNTVLVFIQYRLGNTTDVRIMIDLTTRRDISQVFWVSWPRVTGQTISKATLAFSINDWPLLGSKRISMPSVAIPMKFDSFSSLIDHYWLFRRSLSSVKVPVDNPQRCTMFPATCSRSFNERSFRVHRWPSLFELTPNMSHPVSCSPNSCSVPLMTWFVFELLPIRRSCLPKQRSITWSLHSECFCSSSRGCRWLTMSLSTVNYWISYRILHFHWNNWSWAPWPKKRSFSSTKDGESRSHRLSTVRLSWVHFEKKVSKCSSVIHRTVSLTNDRFSLVSPHNGSSRVRRESSLERPPPTRTCSVIPSILTAGETRRSAMDMSVTVVSCPFYSNRPGSISPMPADGCPRAWPRTGPILPLAKIPMNLCVSPHLGHEWPLATRSTCTSRIHCKSKRTIWSESVISGMKLVINKPFPFDVMNKMTETLGGCSFISIDVSRSMKRKCFLSCLCLLLPAVTRSQDVTKLSQEVPMLLETHQPASVKFLHSDSDTERSSAPWRTCS